jgi:GNAT superfamily N-acetyltransferase
VIRRVRSGEAARIRELRLDALRDAPHAFASSLQRERTHPDAHWSELAEQSDAGLSGVVFVAVSGDRWVGMAAAFWFDQPAGVAQLWGLWVEPAARGQGLGRQLVDEVSAWAGARGAVRVRLGVVDRAPEAAAFYKRLGFAPTGETKALPPDGSVTALFYARDVGVQKGASPGR